MNHRPNAALALCMVAASLLPAMADTTFSPSGRYAYGGNIGWINLAGDTTQGVVVSETYLSGYAYSANCGWISFGSVPGDGVAYANSSATNFGVNHDGVGNLSGYAYGANIGWLNFGWASPSDVNRPRFDLSTGTFSGYVYSSNCGWISLATGFLTSPTMLRPDTDGDGISDAWERKFFGNLTTANATTDQDGDGVLDLDEYLVATKPNDSASYQRTSLSADMSSVTIEFSSHPTRRYRIMTSTDLVAWTDSGLGLITPDAGNLTRRAFAIGGSMRRFFRVTVVLPLSP